MKNIQKFFAALKRRACLYALWGKASECEAFPIRARGGKQGAVCIGHTAEKRASRVFIHAAPSYCIKSAKPILSHFYRLFFGLSLSITCSLFWSCALGASFPGLLGSLGLLFCILALFPEPLRQHQGQGLWRQHRPPFQP